MKSRCVVGTGVCLEQVFGTWSRVYPGDPIRRLKLLPDNHYAFDLSALDVLDPGIDTLFVAFDERFGNFKREELMHAVLARGFQLDTFIAPSAIVASGVVPEPNAFIGESVVVSVGCRIEPNVVVRDGAKLGVGVHLRSSCWVETGVLVGDGADIGTHSILRMGAMVGPHVTIGKHCELGWPQLYREDIAPRTIFDTRYPEPIRVYGN